MLTRDQDWNAAMELNWGNMFKRYVFDDAKTPYGRPVAKLDRTQAGNEMFFYCMLQIVLFGVIALLSASPALPHAGAPIVTFVAVGLCAAAAVLAVTRHLLAAGIVVLAPMACLAYLWVYGFHPRIGGGDKVLLIGVLLL